MSFTFVLKKNSLSGDLEKSIYSASILSDDSEIDDKVGIDPNSLLKGRQRKLTAGFGTGEWTTKEETPKFLIGRPAIKDMIYEEDRDSSNSGGDEYESPLDRILSSPPR